MWRSWYNSVEKQKIIEGYWQFGRSNLGKQTQRRTTKGRRIERMQIKLNQKIQIKALDFKNWIGKQNLITAKRLPVLSSKTTGNRTINESKFIKAGRTAIDEISRWKNRKVEQSFVGKEWFHTGGKER